MAVRRTNSANSDTQKKREFFNFLKKTGSLVNRKKNPTKLQSEDNKDVHFNKYRFSIIVSIPALLFIFLLYSGFKIQVINGAEHRKTVEKLSFTMKKLPVIRGFILDRQLHPLAIPTELYSAAIDPMKLAYSLVKSIDKNDIPMDLKDRTERKKFAFSAELHTKILKLSHELGVAIHDDPYILSEKLFAAILKGSRFMYLKRLITDGEVKALKKIKLKKNTIWFPLESARHYPYRSLATQILGFTSVDGIGMEGIERKFDVELKGSTSIIKARKDAKSGTMLIKGLPDIQVGGADHVVLTIDSMIQHDTEVELEEGLKKFEAKSGSAVVLDAKTGEVLAMANSPVIDPGKAHNLSADVWRNKAVVDAYELGSVVKPLTMAGAIDSGRVTTESDIPLDFKVIFRNKAPWSPKDHISLSRGTIKPWEIISRSSNKGIAKVAELLGSKDLYYLFVNLGFGSTTGIELPSESGGILPPLKQWRNKVFLATHSYGHGFTISLIQLVQAYTIFANKGYMIRPHVVRYVMNDRKQMISCYSPVSCKGKRWRKRKILRHSETAKTVVDMMKLVVTGGTGRKADLRRWGYSVAGKTGTAEKVEKGLAYSTSHNRVTFIGLVPASDPKVIIAVMYDDPKGDPDTFDKNNPEKELRKDAGYISAPVFAKIARKVLYRLGVPPDLQPVSMALTKKQSKSSIKAGTPYIPPLPTPEKVVMPDFLGKTMASLLELLGDLKMDCSIEGHGRVIKQYPEPGGPLKECHILMKPYGFTSKEENREINENSDSSNPSGKTKSKNQK